MQFHNNMVQILVTMVAPVQNTNFPTRSSVCKPLLKEQVHIMVCGQSCHFFESLWVTSHWASAVYFMNRRQLYRCVAASSLNYTSNTCKTCYTKEGISHKDESATKKQEVVMLKLKLKYNVNELQKKQLTVGMLTVVRWRDSRYAAKGTW